MRQILVIDLNLIYKVRVFSARAPCGGSSLAERKAMRINEEERPWRMVKDE
jgi:hypothetical protein